MARFQTYTSRTLPRTRPAQDVQDVQQRYQAQRGVTLAAANLGMQVADWHKEHRRKKDAVAFDEANAALKVDEQRELARVSESAELDENGNPVYTYGGNRYTSMAEAEVAVKADFFNERQSQISNIENKEVRELAQSSLQQEWDNFQISEAGRLMAESESALERSAIRQYAKLYASRDYAGAQEQLRRNYEQGVISKEAYNYARAQAVEQEVGVWLEEYKTLSLAQKDEMTAWLLNDTTLPKELRDPLLTSVRKVNQADAPARKLMEEQEKARLAAQRAPEIRALEYRFEMWDRLGDEPPTIDEIQRLAELKGQDASWVAKQEANRDKKILDVMEDRQRLANVGFHIQSGTPMMHTPDAKRDVTDAFDAMTAENQIGSPDWNLALVTTAQSTSIMPAQGSQFLTMGARADDPVYFASAVETYNGLKQAAPHVDLGISAETEMMYSLAGPQIMAGVDPVVAAKNSRDAMARADDPVTKARMDKEWGKIAGDMEGTVQDFANRDQKWWGLFQPDVTVSPGLRRQYHSLMRSNYYLSGGNVDVAEDMTERQLAGTYGTTMADGAPRQVAFPPEKVYGLQDPKDNWIADQWAEDTAGLARTQEGSRWAMISDDETIRTRGGSYAVVEVLDGVPLGTPVARFQPDPAAKAKRELQDEQDKLDKLYREQQELEKGTVKVAPGVRVTGMNFPGMTGRWRSLNPEARRKTQLRSTERQIGAIEQEREERYVEQTRF